MSGLTRDETALLHAAILGRTNINALPKTERAVERIIADRVAEAHRDAAEQIATEFEKRGEQKRRDASNEPRDFITRLGISYSHAARIARHHATKEDQT